MMFGGRKNKSTLYTPLRNRNVVGVIVQPPQPKPEMSARLVRANSIKCQETRTQLMRPT